MANEQDFERVGAGWEGHVSGMCPVQGEGTVDGVRWYFRARGSHWEMYIAAKPDTDPLDCMAPTFLPGHYMSETFGTWPDAGYMAPAVAWAQIQKGIAAFRAGTMTRIGEEDEQ
jgi:hypothetical protein